MKKFFLCVAFIAAMCSVNAQVEKQRLLVEYFSADGNELQYVDAIRNNIIAGIQATNRMVIIDAASESSLKVEEARRSDVSAMGDDVARNGEIVKLGANFILRGNIDNITVTKKTNDSGNVFYDSTLNFTLNAITVADGSVHGTKTFTVYGGGSLLGAGATAEKAILGAISIIDSKMETFIDEHFPLKGTIVEMKDEKRGKMVSCYINLGVANGISKGQYIKVSKFKEIAGRQSVLEIGQLKVDVAVADDLSECKVTKGGDDIFDAFSNGDEIVIETIRDKGIGGAFKALTF